MLLGVMIQGGNETVEVTILREPPADLPRAKRLKRLINGFKHGS